MDENAPRRPSIKQLSKTPSWVMLGFILGALFVYALPRPEPKVVRPIVLAPVEKKVVTKKPVLTTVESVFTQWSDYAQWSDDTTQIAMWNAEVGDFAEFYELRRIDGVVYFRSIPHLTNRLIRHGKLPPPECPLRFTETEDQYREWRENGRTERPPEITRPSVDQPALTIPAPTPTESQSVALPPPPPVDKEDVSMPNR